MILVLPKNGHQKRSRCDALARRRAERGVTLIELVIVVAMVGVLAALASVGYSRYIRSAKTAEATQMLGAIKSGQEAFKSETFRYLAVSPDLKTPYPQGDPDAVGTVKYAWEGGLPASVRTNFESLGVKSSAPVQYGYASVAGGASQEMPDLPLGFEMTWPDPGGPWYVAVAWADLDGDKDLGGYVTSSLTAAIVSTHEGE